MFYFTKTTFAAVFIAVGTMDLTSGLPGVSASPGDEGPRELMPIEDVDILDGDDIPVLSREETLVYLAEEWILPGDEDTGFQIIVGLDDDLALRSQSFPTPTNEDELATFFKLVGEDAARTSGDDRRRSLATLDKSRGLRGLSSFCNSDDSHQLVYLNFPDKEFFGVYLIDQITNEENIVTLKSFVFTEEEKLDILHGVKTAYNEFNIRFTLEEPVGDDCEYSTLTFARDDFDPILGFSVFERSTEGKIYPITPIVYGRVDGVDFRNKIKTDSGWIDPNIFTCFEQIGVLNAKGFARITGIPVDADTSLEDAIRLATVNKAVKTAAHELGHLLGLNHYSSIGSPGDNPGYDTLEFTDGYYIDTNAIDQSDSETWLHIMGGGDDLGAPLAMELAFDQFFSERSAIKLALGTNRQDLLYSEEMAKKLGGSVGSGKKKKGMKLKQLTVPNTILEGTNSGKNLATSATVIEGNIDGKGPDGADHYRFRFKQGQVITVEGISFGDALVILGEAGFSAAVATGLTISKEDENDGELTALYTHYQSAESFDPMILDFEIPETGNYVVSIFAPGYWCLPAAEGEYNCRSLEGVSPEDGINYDDFNHGDYSLLVYSVDKVLGPAK